MDGAWQTRPNPRSPQEKAALTIVQGTARIAGEAAGLRSG